MRRLPTRQIHLDFHTSEFIEEVGPKFDKQQFQKALKMGNVNSVTVFAKGHHGWCYYPTKVGQVHPTMPKGMDLTGAMIDAAHEINVACPIYITVGWSANDATEHPEWHAKKKDGSSHTVNYDFDAKPEDPRDGCSWITLCPNNRGYRNHILELTEEIASRYENVDGLFYDIVFVDGICYCDDCVSGMKAQGLDIENKEDALLYYTKKRQEFMKQCRQILNKNHPDATIFFNSGGAEINQPQWHDGSTHFELEDLPTAWGGYDKLPMRAKYFAGKGRDYLAMSGKFHTAWGEFGGYKSPDAMKYECASMMTYGARCSIGDQMPPNGIMDLETYRLIGQAYNYVEEIEDYCMDASETTRLGVFISSDNAINEGLSKMLLDAHMDFDIVHEQDNLARFDVIILPDNIRLDSEDAKRVNDYIKKGGKLLLSGTSGLMSDDDKYAIDMGIEYKGQSQCDIDYAKLGDKVNKDIVTSPFLFYKSANKNEVIDSDVEILAQIYEPHFNRTYGKYCSHQFTPYKESAEEYPAAIKKENIIYIAHPICEIYNKVGAQFHRDYFINCLKLIYTNPVLKVDMLSAGRVRFVRQESKNRYIMHALYGSPVQKGLISVIEDLPPIYNVPVNVEVDEVIKSATLIPGNEAVSFEQKENHVSFTIPRVQCHQMVVLEY